MGNSHKLSNTNKKSSDTNSLNNTPNGGSTIEQKMSQDNYSRIKQVLNSLYKNDFVSLSFVFIQIYL